MQNMNQAISVTNAQESTNISYYIIQFMNLHIYTYNKTVVYNTFRYHSHNN